MELAASPNSDDGEFQLRDLLTGLDATNNQPSITHRSQNTSTELHDAEMAEDLHSGTPRRGLSRVVSWSTRSQGPSQAGLSPSIQEQRPLEIENIGNALSFDRPIRSIFSSPQPTSSVSANTAHASMSMAGGGLSSTGSAMRSLGQSTDANAFAPSLATNYSIPGTEKDLDDPTSSTTLLSELNLSTTSQALTSLFAPSESNTSGLLSRRTTQGGPQTTNQRIRMDTSTLGGHLYHVGFRDGRHSDITIHAFGEEYKLHKLILERLPFFSSAFSERWNESATHEMTMEPNDIDPNITKISFELAIRRVYGTIIPEDEQKESVSLFATACWLDMSDLVESCIESLLRQMDPENLHRVIKLVTQSCYGKPGDRLLASAKAMLCRDGWEMPFEFWDDIPADVVRDVISGDAFYVPTEWERWFLTVRLLNRRLRHIALSENMISASGSYILPRPKYLTNQAIRLPVSSKTSDSQCWNEDDAWQSLYTHPEIVPLIQLLDTGIYYMHLRFEQLQQLKLHRDIFGVPLLPEQVISDALWMSMELRQRVLNAHEGDLELNLAQTATTYDDEPVRKDTSDISDVKKGKRKVSLSGTSSIDSSDISHTQQKDIPRRFWIPHTDVSCVMGGSSEAYAASSLAAPTDISHRSQNITGSFEPSDVAWPPDLGGSIFDSHGPLSRNFSTPTPPKYSTYPPFRFCAEFPNPRTLKEKKRVYSQTVWYAGSMWNLYIQRVNTTKSQQLGIYLHRAKDKETSNDPLALTVDDRIGQLERDMLLRKNERRYRYFRPDQISGSGDIEQDDESNEGTAGSNNNNNHGQDRTHTGSVLTSPTRKAHKTSQTSPRPPLQSQSSQASRPNIHQSNSTSSDPPSISMTDDDPETELFFLRSSSKQSISTIPPYVDSRPTINTYYKIYSPSRGGRLMSMYESAPDSFDFGKSWGWRSCQMILDDGIGDTNTMQGKDGKLRYMVVLGNV